MQNRPHRGPAQQEGAHFRRMQRVSGLRLRVLGQTGAQAVSRLRLADGGETRPGPDAMALHVVRPWRGRAGGAGRMSDVRKVTVIGAGLAGSEAAWQIARRGVPVVLYEMRPARMTPAHHTDRFAELVCSNSFRAAGLTNAVGVLKEEMRRLDSLIMREADRSAVPAGGALAVDRDRVTDGVTRALEEHPLVEIRREEITDIPGGIVVVATGPLTSPALSDRLRARLGEEYLYFYDAAAPIVEKDSIDMDKVFVASRYGKGEAAYLNCPMDEKEFDAFYEALVTAERAPLKDFEKEIYFEGCMPIEVMAKRGRETLLFGPLKPVGLTDPRTGKRPFA